MKKLAILVGAFLLVALFASPALAAPPWYDGAGGYDAKDLHATSWETHRVLATDGLIDPTGGTASGFVTFVCQSQDGFEYSIDVKDLAAGSYEVRGIPLADEPEYVPDVGVVPVTSDDYGLYPYLVIDTIVVSSEGEVEGVVGLDPGFYLWQVDVVDSTGTVALTTMPSPDGVEPGDHVGFSVYP